jgi:hypothetical protein
MLKRGSQTLAPFGLVSEIEPDSQSGLVIILWRGHLALHDERGLE